MLDSTLITLPKELASHFAGHNSPGAAAVLKIQLSMDYLTGRLNALHIGAGPVPDQNSLQLFDSGTSYHICDLWEKADLGVTHGTLRKMMEPHSAVLYRLQRAWRGEMSGSNVLCWFTWIEMTIL